MKILIIQLRRIGDILLTTPVVSYLKQVFPDSKIDFLAEACGKSVLETNPKIREFILYDKKQALSIIKRIRAEKYSAVIDFINNPRSSLITALSGAKWRVGLKRSLRSICYNVAAPDPKQSLYVPLWKIELVKAWLKKMGIPAAQPQQFRPEIYPTKDDMEFAQHWRQKENLKGDYAILIPTHRHPIRRWRWEGFQELGLKLHREKNWPIYLAWGPGEEELINQIRKGHEKELKILPNTTIRQSAAIFRKARLVITNDSGLMHTAVAAGAPTVTIYGPTRATDWNPSFVEKADPPRDLAISARDVACLGCHLDECPVGHLCMTHLTAEEVFSTMTRNWTM